MRGIFITIEGPDGAGKSTQIGMLTEFLQAKGYDVQITRDPGGTKVGEAVRSVLLNKDNTEMGYMTELLLYTAARAQLAEEVIRPALSGGKAVIVDRFVDSSAVYQGIGRGLGTDAVYKLNKYALQGTFPDMTFLLDLDAETGLARKKNQAELDRMERESIEFHRKVVDGYRSLAALVPERIIKVDAALPKERIHAIIASYVEAWFAKA